MLYINYNNSSKRLYINIKVIGKALLGIIMLIAYFYMSNQEYLTVLGNY